MWEIFMQTLCDNFENLMYFFLPQGIEHSRSCLLFPTSASVLLYCICVFANRFKVAKYICNCPVQ